MEAKEIFRMNKNIEELERYLKATHCKVLKCSCPDCRGHIIDSQHLMSRNDDYLFLRGMSVSDVERLDESLYMEFELLDYCKKLYMARLCELETYLKESDCKVLKCSSPECKGHIYDVGRKEVVHGEYPDYSNASILEFIPIEYVVSNLDKSLYMESDSDYCSMNIDNDIVQTIKNFEDFLEEHNLKVMFHESRYIHDNCYRYSCPGHIVIPSDNHLGYEYNDEYYAEINKILGVYYYNDTAIIEALSSRYFLFSEYCCCSNSHCPNSKEWCETHKPNGEVNSD